MKMTRGYKTLAWVAGAGLALVALVAALWVWKFHRYTPAEVVQDLKAGIAARNAPRPVERYLELRYGSLEVPGNRQKAFLDFFNVGHIEGLQIMTSHMKGPERASNIAAMAQWVADYRRTLTPAEKEALLAQIGTPAGRVTLQQATAQYLKQDVHYRAATAPVIRELMTTISSLQKP